MKTCSEHVSIHHCVPLMKTVQYKTKGKEKQKVLKCNEAAPVRSTWLRGCRMSLRRGVCGTAELQSLASLWADLGQHVNSTLAQIQRLCLGRHKGGYKAPSVPHTHTHGHIQATGHSFYYCCTWEYQQTWCYRAAEEASEASHTVYSVTGTPSSYCTLLHRWISVCQSTVQSLYFEIHYYWIKYYVTKLAKKENLQWVKIIYYFK